MVQSPDYFVGQLPLTGNLAGRLGLLFANERIACLNFGGNWLRGGEAYLALMYIGNRTDAFCNCQEIAPADMPDLREELLAWVTELSIQFVHDIPLGTRCQWSLLVSSMGYVGFTMSSLGAMGLNFQLQRKIHGWWRLTEGEKLPTEFSRRKHAQAHERLRAAH